jgi:thiol:disulfide interchange protein
MNRASTIALMTIRISGLLLLLLGLAIWTGRADGGIPIHELLGFVLVVALWTLSYFAARAGVPMRWVVLAVAWGLAAPLLGLTQENLVDGDWHWTIQVLHLLIGAGAIGQGENLALRMRQIGSPRATSGSAV